MNADVIVTGHLCLDLIPEMAQVPLDALNRPGNLSEVGPLGLSAGGAVTNVGLSLQRLGASVRLMASVGDDLIGGAIVDFLSQRDPELTRTIRVRPGENSSYSIVLSPEKVDRIFLHCAGTNSTFGLDDIDFEAVAQARVLHLGYPTILPRTIANDGDELVAIFQRAKATGVVTSLDMALPDPNGPSGRVDWPTILRRTLPYVDVFVPSIEEILFMLRRADFDAWRGHVLAHIDAGYLSSLADELIEMGVTIAGFKLGSLGLFVQAAGAERVARLDRLPLKAAEWACRRVWKPAFQVNVAGTTGAGDSAYAGLIGALLRGLPPDETARRACAVGACNVEASDSTSGVRPWDEVSARLDAGWAISGNSLPGAMNV